MLNGRTTDAQPGAFLVGLGTAPAEHRATQGQVASFLEHAAAAQGATPRFLKLLASMAEGTGVAHRHSAIADYVGRTPDQFTFYPKDWKLDPFPTTADRMALYQQTAVPLAERAAKKALEDAAIAPERVTHLVISTCTGFFAPGPDIALVRDLGLAPTVERTIIGFMGCYAGVNAMRLSDRIVRSDPRAVVLQVSVELCSLHFQREPTVPMLVANLLFADGASAAVYAGEGSGRARVAGSRSAVAAASEDQMRWDIGDHGFVMHLDRKVPRTIEREAAPFVRALLDSGPAASGRTRWAIHPGGRRVVEAAAQSVDLTESDVKSSFDVLRDYGNMSSATILFVLERELARADAGDRIALLGFGPGLTIEGVTVDVL